MEIATVLCCLQASRFVDRVYVVAKGGNGGDGMMSFTSEFCKEWAGPDGGNGGNGGHVIFQGHLYQPTLFIVGYVYGGWIMWVLASEDVCVRLITGGGVCLWCVCLWCV